MFLCDIIKIKKIYTGIIEMCISNNNGRLYQFYYETICETIVFELGIRIHSLSIMRLSFGRGVVKYKKARRSL